MTDFLGKSKAPVPGFVSGTGAGIHSTCFRGTTHVPAIGGLLAPGQLYDRAARVTAGDAVGAYSPPAGGFRSEAQEGYSEGLRMPALTAPDSLDRKGPSYSSPSRLLEFFNGLSLAMGQTCVKTAKRAMRIRSDPRCRPWRGRSGSRPLQPRLPLRSPPR